MWGQPPSAVRRSEAPQRSRARALTLYRIKGIFYRIPPNNNHNCLTIRDVGRSYGCARSFVQFHSEVMP